MVDLGDPWFPEPDPPDQLDEVYRERNALVAFLANLYDGVFIRNSDDEPGWGIVYIETRYGQMSWHIPPRDFDLFEDVEEVESYEWDGHSTEEKYGRLACLRRYVYRWLRSTWPRSWRGQAKRTDGQDTD